MNGLDLVKEYPNVVSKDLCDEIIDRFEADDLKRRGKAGNGDRSDLKISTDLYISILDHWADIDDKIYNAIKGPVEEYLFLLRDNFAMPELYRIRDQGYQIQRTTPGGKFEIHHDHTSYPYTDESYINSNGDPVVTVRERIFTYILYLNDRRGMEDGTTSFYFGPDKKIVYSEPGKLLLFPANWLYPHSGDPLTTGAKYLLTGWVTRDSICRTGNHDNDLEVRRDIALNHFGMSLIEDNL